MGFLNDRHVYAILPDGAELVKYIRAGKYKYESPTESYYVNFDKAIELATQNGAEVQRWLPQGQAFERRVRKAKAASNG